MLTLTETYRLAVELASVRDAEIFEHVAAKHPGDLEQKTVTSFGELARAFQAMLDSYDFTESDAFHDSVAGKGEAVVSMARKLAMQPLHRKRHLERLVQALVCLPQSREAFLLLPERHHKTLWNALALLGNGQKAKAQQGAPIDAGAATPPRRD